MTKPRLLFRKPPVCNIRAVGETVLCRTLDYSRSRLLPNRAESLVFLTITLSFKALLYHSCRFVSFIQIQAKLLGPYKQQL